MKIFIVFILLISGHCFSQSKEYKQVLEKYYDGFPTISIESAKNKIGEKNVYFIDTRETKEYNIGHIEGAIHAGYDHFSIKTLSDVPKDGQIIIYCSIGARSQDIGKRLKRAGYQSVHNLYGGIFHWANSGYPMINAMGRSTVSVHGYSKEWGKWVTTGNVVY